MTGAQIDRILFGNPLTKKFYLGTFAADQIPPLVNYPAAFVLNMDNSDKPGSHWVAVFVPEKRRVLYYDSFGVAPSNQKIQAFLDSFAEVHANPLTFQSIITAICGYYVIFFIYMCSMGYGFDKIVRTLRKQDNRDVFVYKYVNKFIV